MALALLALLAAVSSVGAADPLAGFAKLQRTVLPWAVPLRTVAAPDAATVAAACLNASSAPTPPPCAWSALLPNTWLSSCASEVNCVHFDALADAQAACALDATCFGLTSQPNGLPPWELRRGPSPQPSPTGESSYALENADTCRTGPTASCNAFDTRGNLYHCPGDRCDCDAGAASCARGRDIFSADPAVSFGSDSTDLWVMRGNPVPADLAAAYAAGRLLWGSPEAAECYMPEVGNGYVATTISWGSLHVAGLFNGRCGSVEKARLPSPVALTILGAGASVGPLPLIGGALDTDAGLYRRRFSAVTAAGSAVVLEQRIFAHRSRRNLLVTDLNIVGGAPPALSDFLQLNLTTLWAASPGGRIPSGGHVPGDGCAGGLTQDLVFLRNASVGAGALTFDARTTQQGDGGELWNVSFVVELSNATTPVTLSYSAPNATFLAVVTTTLDSLAAGGDGSSAAVSGLALAAYGSAVAAGPTALLSEHLAAWAAINAAGIEVEAASPGDAGLAARALDIAQHAAASYYYLVSSVREDWPAGISPGGIASGSYSGAVFMDMDLWMAPSLYLLAPSLAESVLEYRFASLRTERQIAATFGWGGTMVAWTAGYDGRLYGCCSGHGEYEDCLEQHVTGAVAFSAWQFFASTGNISWLQSRGMQILAGAADFHLSRVTPTGGGNYSLKGVLPIDEWCVGSGCGCETPGVDDDAEQNAVARLSLQLAARAATLLGNSTPHSNLWASVSEGVRPLFNETTQRHDQFNSPTCPGGHGGSHYSDAHTVCPEDVNLLTYPFGDYLAQPFEVAMRDALYFVPLTCRENAGMTTTMHTILWLYLSDGGRNASLQALAMGEFNRSLHAADYGPFAVRNEVDKHADVTGAHYDNSKFLTGDGGFLQSLVNGFGGLRIADETTLRLLRPSLPDSVGRLRLRRLSWHGRLLTLDVDSAMATLTNAVGGSGAIGVTEGPGGGGACTLLVLGTSYQIPSGGTLWPYSVTESC